MRIGQDGRPTTRRSAIPASDIFHYPERLAKAPSIAAVCGDLLSEAEPFGFTVYAIGALPHPEMPYPGGFMVTNWPREWQSAYFERQFGDRDPTLRAVAISGQTVSVDDIRQGKAGFQPSPQELEVLDFAAALGLPTGLIVPVFRAQGYAGLACLCGAGPEPTAEIRTRLQFVLEHTHDRLRALCAAPAPGRQADLSPRERQILILARQGLSDARIAEAADISVRTVRFHFDNIRRKLAARSRAEAIAIAVGRHLLPA